MTPSSSTDPSGSSTNSTASYSGSHSTPPTATSHTFERIQFKSATANNGKRRAQQQYYHLIVELWADIRQPNDREPNWVKVAERSSSQVVVRGRSPSHYSNEGPNGVGRGGSAGGLGGGHSMAPGAWPVAGGMPGHHGFGGGATSMNQYRGMGSGGSGAFHGLGEHHSSSGSHPTDLHQLTALSTTMLPTVDSLSLPSSSTSSGSLLPTQMEDRIPDDDSKLDSKLDTYTYFPGPLYEAGLANPKVSIKSESQGGQLDEPTTNHTASYTLPSPWAASSCRMVGLESSRGLYPWSTTNHEASY
jgi:meiosis-specific transcription factor NDT80